MYATAHLVRSHLTGREGINAFVHQHGRHFAWPRDAAALPEEEPGVLKDEIISIRPGGNSVRAYLDILAPDETSSEELLAILNEIPRLTSNTKIPSITRHKNVTIRFGVELGLANKKAEQLSMLASALRPLLETWSAS
jgi:hypothetical protein